MRIETADHVLQGLDELQTLDPRLAAVRSTAGEVPLRLRAPGFESLAGIIVAQQVSRASADAIFARLRDLVSPLTGEGLLAAEETVFRRAGLSRPKQRALLAVAEAESDGRLDLKGVSTLEAREAIAAMSAVKGIGPWTAEVYLLACAGHADVFPSRDVALQSAVGHALGLAERPDARTLAALAEAWSPWRAVAARLFWAYYARTRGREAAPLLQTDPQQVSNRPRPV